MALTGASYRTTNFIVYAADARLAEELAEVAEAYRYELAIGWLGKPLPAWNEPCPIHARTTHRSWGETTFRFADGKAFDWKMVVEGPRTRLLDSVVPHEVTHTVLATHFGRPLPRWADEGASLLAEHAQVRSEQELFLRRLILDRRHFSLRHILLINEYPDDLLPFYAQGYSLTQFLLLKGGKRQFIEFLEDGLHEQNWQAAAARSYGFTNLSELQFAWVTWVRQPDG